MRIERMRLKINDEVESIIGNLTIYESDQLGNIDKRIYDLSVSRSFAIMDKALLIRQICHNHGIASFDLKKLASKSGEPFVELVKTNLFRKAVAGCGSKREEAYLCAKIKFGQWRMECGWVKGKPKRFKAEEGISGTSYRCRICARVINERVD